MAAPPEIFDRSLLRRRRVRAAPAFATHDFLHRLAAESLLERRADMLPQMPRVLCLGGQEGLLVQQLRDYPNTHLVMADMACNLLPQPLSDAVILDEEYLPFAPQSFDAIVSNLTLQHVNDLPGVLRQCFAALAPQGAFLAAVLGGGTLQELRHCLTQAELMLCGGASPRVAPAISAESATALLQRAGFNAPVVDSEKLTVEYPDILALMRELRAMGFGNILRARSRRLTPRTLFAEAGKRYAAQFSAPAGGIRATFELIYLHGWRP